MSGIRSAAIAQFERDTTTDPEGALGALRARLEANRGPLVEEVSGDPRNVLVTFVWIGDAAAVALSSPLVGMVNLEPLANRLSRVEGTDVWHLSRIARRDTSTTYQFIRDDGLAERPGSFRELLVFLEPRTFSDPFNPDVLHYADVREGQGMSILTLPNAEPLPWFEGPIAEPGRVESETFTSAALGYERTISIYTPAGYDPSGPAYPLIVQLDGEGWVNEAEEFRAFDRLIAAGRIPPVVIVFVHNAPSDEPFGGRRAHELNANPDFARMIVDELLPTVRARYSITDDPARSVISGVSFGGLASSYIGLRNPEVFGNVLACSPAVWWGYAAAGERFMWDDAGEPVWLTDPDEEPEWLIRQYAATERLPLRFWIDVGRLEVAPMMPSPANGLDYRAAVRHLRTVLIAKGYDVTYYESPGGHDWATFRRCFVKGFETLLN